MRSLSPWAASIDRLPDVQCQFDCPPPVQPPSDASRAILWYRIDQEAVNNALKHAKAKHARIALADSAITSNPELKITTSRQNQNLTGTAPA